MASIVLCGWWQCLPATVVKRKEDLIRTKTRAAVACSVSSHAFACAWACFSSSCFSCYYHFSDSRVEITPLSGLNRFSSVDKMVGTCILVHSSGLFSFFSPAFSICRWFMFFSLLGRKKTNRSTSERFQRAGRKRRQRFEGKRGRRRRSWRGSSLASHLASGQGKWMDALLFRQLWWSVKSYLSVPWMWSECAVPPLGFCQARNRNGFWLSPSATVADCLESLSVPTSEIRMCFTLSTKCIPNWLVDLITESEYSPLER